MLYGWLFNLLEDKNDSIVRMGEGIFDKKDWFNMLLIVC